MSGIDLMNLAATFRRMPGDKALDIYQRVQSGRPIGLKLLYYPYPLWIVKDEQRRRKLLARGERARRICLIADVLKEVSTAAHA